MITRVDKQDAASQRTTSASTSAARGGAGQGKDKVFSCIFNTVASFFAATSRLPSFLYSQESSHRGVPPRWQRTKGCRKMPVTATPHVLPPRWQRQGWRKTATHAQNQEKQLQSRLGQYNHNSMFKFILVMYVYYRDAGIGAVGRVGNVDGEDRRHQ